MLGVCLALEAVLRSGVPHPPGVFVPVHRFTLAWTHSIEKTRWEEDYEVVPGPGGIALLRPMQARIRGSGAGMEPPPDAVLHDGWYEYQPGTPPLHRLLLTRSGYTADYDWCRRGACRKLGALLPSDGGVTRLWPCRGMGSPDAEPANGRIENRH